MTAAGEVPSGDRHAAPTCPDARILVVDDGGANVELLERVLTGAGYTHVRGFTDPNELLDRIDRDAPDLIFLDLHTPLDGLGLIRELRTRFPKSVELPIIVLTADVTPDAKHRSLLAGASDFLTKPLDRTEVLCRAANLLEAHDLYRQLLSRQFDLESLVTTQTEKLQERLYDLGRLDQERRKLLSHLVHAEEEERRTIASDIHDDPIQKMVAASMRLDMVLQDHPELAADEQFHKAQDTVTRSIESLRSLMFELRPYVLDHDGLAAALAVLVQEEGKLAAEHDIRRPQLPALRTTGERPRHPVPHRARGARQRPQARARDHGRDRAGGGRRRVHPAGQGRRCRLRTLGDLGSVARTHRADLDAGARVPGGGWFRIQSAGGSGTVAEAWIPREDEGAAA